MRSIRSFTFILPMLLTSFMVSCQSNTTGFSRLEVEAFATQIDQTKNQQVVDVRTPEEFRGGHLEDAINIDWNDDNFDSGLSGLQKDRAVFLYCLSGGRSASAAKRLSKLGFKEVYDLKGGIIAWQQADRPVIMSDGVLAKEEMSLEAYNAELVSDVPVLVDFYAPWCAPCKKMSPMLDALQKEYPSEFKFVKLNADEHKALMKTLEVREIPTLLVYGNGELKWQHVGLTDKSSLLKVLAIDQMLQPAHQRQ